MTKASLIIICVIICSTALKAQTLSGFTIQDSIVEKGATIKSNVSKSMWKKVSKALSDVDPSLYKIEYVSGDNFVGKGSANLRRLAPISVVGSGNTAFRVGNMIQVAAVPSRGSVSDAEFIRLIWTTEATIRVADKVAEVNAILKGDD